MTIPERAEQAAKEVLSSIAATRLATEDAHERMAVKHITAAIEAAIIEERERVLKLVATGQWAPTGHGALCLECGRWTPDRHPERHDHKETCSWSGREFSGREDIARIIRLQSTTL
jgi:hypothetical protein